MSLPLRESQFKDAEAFVKATQITVEQWDAYVQRINKCKISVLCIALLCNIFVFKFPGYKLPAITSFEYFIIMLFVIQSIGHQMRLSQSSSANANYFQGIGHPLHTANHDLHGSSNGLQPVGYIDSSTFFSTHEFHIPTVPNSGMPGFDINGTYTGSDTAIGGVSC